MAETSNNQYSLKPEQVSEQSIVEILLELEATGEIPARTYNAAIKAIKDSENGKKNRADITAVVKDLVAAMEGGEGSPKLTSARKKVINRVSAIAGMQAIPSKPGETPPDLEGTHEISSEGDIVQDMASSVNQDINQLLGLMMSLKNNRWEKPSNRPANVDALNQRLQSNITDLKALQETEKRLNKPLMDLLNRLVKQKKISADERKELIALNPSQENFQQDLHEITGPLLEKGDHQTANAITTALKKDAAERKKIDEELRQKIVEYRKIMDEIGEDVNTEAARQLELQRLGRYVGFDIKQGKKIRLKDRRKKLVKKTIQGGRTIWVEQYKELPNGDKQYIYEDVYRVATIKSIEYTDLHYVDENGKQVKIPSNQPLVEFEVIDETPDERGIKNKSIEKHPAGNLRRIADEFEMVETIAYSENLEDATEDLSQLSRIINTEIKQGDILEYEDHLISDTTKIGTPKTIQIVGFSKKKDPSESAVSTYVELSEAVVTATEPTVQKEKILTLAEFARWYKRVNAIHQMDLPTLREKLKQEFESRNQNFPDRDEQMYPPIAVEKDELLYYDTGDQYPPTFLIKNVTDKGIEFDNGEILTPTAFYLWVKDNQVEKKTAQAEAYKEAAMIEDPEEKAKVQELAEQIHKEKIALEKQKREEENAVLASTKEVPPPSVNLIRKIYNETYFLRGGDLYEIGKEIYEYIKRYMDRTGKGRIGVVGDMMLSPIHKQLGAEFQTLAQSAETENVNRYKEQYSNFGVIQLYDRLAATSNKDELKAILYTLADKGSIRWEDMTVIKAINRVGKYISGYTHMPKYDEGLLAKNLDSFWGEQTFNELKTKNNSSYNSTKSSFQEEARRLQNAPESKGGLAIKMRQLLFKHKKGEWVDPAEYEGYLFYAIQAGQLSFPEKVFFIFMGLGAMSPAGSSYSSKPLLNFVRISDMEGQLLNNFPIIDFFTNSKVQQYDDKGRMIKDEKGELVKKTMDINFVHKIMNEYMNNLVGPINSPDDLTPPTDFIEYVERDMMMDDGVLVRLAEKASGNMSNWDHDDFHMFGSRLGESQMEQIATPGGAKQATIAGVKNTFVGLNHYTNIFIEEFIKANETGHKEQADKYLVNMVNTLRSFVRLDAILDARYYHENHDRMRLSNELNSFAGVDGEQERTVKMYNEEMKNFINGMITQMNSMDPSVLKSIGADAGLFKKVKDEWATVNAHYGATQVNKQNEQKDAVKNFGQDFSQALGIVQKAIGNKGVIDMIHNVQYGGGKKLIKGINKANLTKEDERIGLPTQLESADPVNLRNQLIQIEQLEQELTSSGGKTKEQIEAEKDARTEAVIEAIKQGKTEGLSSEDSALLDRRIDKLQAQLREKTT